MNDMYLISFGFFLYSSRNDFVLTHLNYHIVPICSCFYVNINRAVVYSNNWTLWRSLGLRSVLMLKQIVQKALFKHLRYGALHND